MPISGEEWPLEPEDHVVLDKEIELNGYGRAILVVPAGTHGVVKIVDGDKIYVEFGAQMFKMTHPTHDLTLYRRSQHSRRRK